MKPRKRSGHLVITLAADHAGGNVADTRLLACSTRKIMQVGEDDKADLFCCRGSNHCAC